MEPHHGYGLEMHEGIPRLPACPIGLVNVLSPEAVDQATDCCIQEDLIGEPTVVQTGGGRIVGKDETGRTSGSAIQLLRHCRSLHRRRP